MRGLALALAAALATSVAAAQPPVVQPDPSALSQLVENLGAGCSQIDRDPVTFENALLVGAFLDQGDTRGDLPLLVDAAQIGADGRSIDLAFHVAPGTTLPVGAAILVYAQLGPYLVLSASAAPTLSRQSVSLQAEGARPRIAILFTRSDQQPIPSGTAVEIASFIPGVSPSIETITVDATLGSAAIVLDCVTVPSVSLYVADRGFVFDGDVALWGPQGGPVTLTPVAADAVQPSR